MGSDAVLTGPEFPAFDIRRSWLIALSALKLDGPLDQVSFRHFLNC